MKKLVILTCALLIWCIAPSAKAVTFNLEDVKFGINGYLDLKYVYMTQQTTSGGMRMKDMSKLKQEQLNLLFDVQKDRFRAHLNFQSENTYSSENGGEGVWKVEEAYGEYRFNDRLVVKAGSALAPFGIYNEIRYITSLFAPVVLPFMYKAPGVYDGGTVVNLKSNIIVGGTWFGDTTEVNYNAYVSTGDRNGNGEDSNKNKGLGARVRLTLAEDYKIGASYYTVENDMATEGVEEILGLDVALQLSENLLLEGEYVKNTFKLKENRVTYYARMTYKKDKFSPFIMYDYFEDPADTAFKNKQNRYGIGTGYDVSNNVILKSEYHYHKFANKVDLVKDTDTAHMLMMAVVFLF
jgi:opacity protein-like surface antigen